MKNLIYLSLLLGFFLVSCSGGPILRQEPKVVEVSCTESRLDTAYDFYEKSRGFLESFYKTRRESELYYSWYSSEDSVYMISTVKRCTDKRNKHFYAAQNLLRRNKAIQKLILGNMRTEDQAEVAGIFLENYRKIFPRDIR